MYKNERELQMKLKDFLNSLGYIAVVDPLDYYDGIGVKCPKPLLEKRFNITGLNELACGFLGHATIIDLYTTHILYAGNR